MSQHKNFACFFFFIFSLVWSPYAYTMEEVADTGDDMSKFLPDEESSPLPLIRSLDEDQELLEALYGRAASRVIVPESTRQVVSGFASLVPLIPTGQVFVPLSLIGLLSLGLTPAVVPDVGWESWVLVGGMGTPIAIAALIGTYNGASNLFKPTPSAIVEAQKKAFRPSFSRLESWSQSYLTQFVEFAFYGGLFFAILMNTESRVTGWGDYRILGGIFGACAAVAVYFILVRASNNMSRYSYRSYANEEEEEQQQAIVGVIAATKEYIKDNGLDENSRPLAQLLNIIASPLPLNFNSRVINISSRSKETRDSTHSLQGINGFFDPASEGASTESLNSHFPDGVEKAIYQEVFEKMTAINQTAPSWIKNWNSWSTTIAKYSSRITQMGSIPAQEVIAFSLPYTLFAYLDVPPAVTWSVSALSTLAYTCFLPGITIRENALIWQEHEQLLRLYKPHVTCGYFGERIAPWLSRGGTLLYFTFPFTDFIRNSLLKNVIGITNAPAQIAILLPFMAGIGLAGPSQFLDYTYTTLSNWLATGGPITFPGSERTFKLSHFFHPIYYYLFCCCFCAGKNKEDALEAMERREEDRASAFELVKRLQEMENNASQTNSQLISQLSITLPSQEDTRLVPVVVTDKL